MAVCRPGLVIVTVSALIQLFLLQLPHAVAAPIRPVVWGADGVPTASSVIENPVKGQALWDQDMVLEGNKLNLLVYMGFCPQVCIWVPEFMNRTGIDVAVHCWAPKREDFRCRLTGEGQCDMYDLDFTGEERWKVCEPFGGNIYVLPQWDMHKADNTQGFLGGMDAQLAGFGAPQMIPAQNDWCCEDDWNSRPDSVAADLTPFLSTSEFDWLSVLPIVREVFATSGTSVVSLPMDIDAVVLLHQDTHVNLPLVATWDEYVAELRRLSLQDRDGDGVADKPFCFRGGEGSGLQSALLTYIATSFFQVRGQQDTSWRDLKNFDPLLQTSGWRETAKIYVDIRSMEYLEIDEQMIYKKGKCVCRMDLINDEVPASYVTSVGSTRVQNRKKFSQDGTDELIECVSTNVCPEAEEGTAGKLVNKGHPVMRSGWGWHISKSSKRTEEAWKFLEFFMQPKVTFFFLLQGYATPWLETHFNASNWEYFAKEDSEALSANEFHPLWPSKWKTTKIMWQTPLEDRRALLARSCDTSILSGPMCMSKYTNSMYAALSPLKAMAFTESRLFRHPTFTALETITNNVATELYKSGDNATKRDLILSSASRLLNDSVPDPARGNEYFGITKKDLITDYRRVLGAPLAPRSTDSACPPGYFMSGGDGTLSGTVVSTLCLPCRPGYRGDNVFAVNNTCVKCESGKYQPKKGSVTCVPCPALTTTLKTGSTSVEDCSVPYLKVDPSFARTPVDLLWAIDEIFQVDEEERQVPVKFWIVSTWRDDRVGQVLDPAINTLTTDEWKEQGFWVPALTIENEVDVVSLQDEINVVRINGGAGTIAVTVTRISLLSTTLEWPDTALDASGKRIPGLTWLFFPFGKLTLDIRLNCPSDATCTCQVCNNAPNNRRLLGNHAQPQPDSAASELQDSRAKSLTADCLADYRRATTKTGQGVATVAGGAVSHAGMSGTPTVGARAIISNQMDGPVTKSSLDTWPNETMSLLSARYVVQMEEDLPFLVIQVQVQRNPTLFLTGIIVPSVLMVILTVMTFVGKDNYNKLGISFTTLLMMAVYADQVKQSTPEHVTYLTWIDIFILSNLIFIVISTVTACVMIFFEESDYDDKWFGADMTDAFGKAICYTQAPFIIVLNLVLVLVGVAEGQKDKSEITGNSLLALSLCLNLASVLGLVLCTWHVARRSTNDEGDTVTEPPAVSEQARQPSSPPEPAVVATLPSLVYWRRS